jgi:hypothetical protein
MIRRYGCALLLAALVACSSGDEGGSSPPPPKDEPALALLGVTSMRDTPWPSDAFLRDGRIDVKSLPLEGNASAVEALAAALSELDGAPVHTSAFFPLATALPDGFVDGKARWIDLDDASAAEIETRLFARQSTQEIVALAPRAVLAEGHRHAVVVESSKIAPSREMSDALAGKGALGPAYAPLAQRLAGKSVAAATVFTVGHATRVVESMREVAASRPPAKARVDKLLLGAAIDDLFGRPSTTRPGLGDPAGVVHDQIGAVVLGTFDAPSFLSDAPPRLGRVTFDAQGKPVVKGTEPVPFMLTLPKRPAGGYAKTPVMIFQHGLNAGRSQVATCANDYARAGFATIGIDAVWHGERSPKKKDAVHNFANGAPGADGLADADDFGAAINLFDFDGDASQGIGPFDGRVVRDNFRQAIVDFAELARFAKAGDVSAIAAADPSLSDLTLDASRLVYTSESFGSVIGVSAFATSPDLDAAVLSVGGASIFLAAVPSSPLFSGLVGPFLRTNFDPALDVSDPAALPGEAQRSLSLLQAAIGPGDPVSFAPKIPERKKPALLLQARSDELIPNQSGELLALAVRATSVSLPSGTEPPRFVTLPSTQAPYEGAPTIALVQMAPALHTMFTAFGGERRWRPDFPPFVPLGTPEQVSSPIEAVHDLAIAFARSLRERGAPRVEAVAR